MQCAVCKRDRGEFLSLASGDPVWNFHLCSLCRLCHLFYQEGKDEVELSKALWVRGAVLDTGGDVRTQGDRTEYIYERANWMVTFERSVLDHVLVSKNERALYAELYRWHRDPAVAFPAETREWIRAVVDRTMWFVFESFAACEGGAGVRYRYDGSIREAPIGLRAQLAMDLRDEPAFTHWVLDVGNPLPGSNGTQWVYETVSGTYCGAGKSGGLRFTVLSLGTPTFFEVPRSVVNNRDIRALRSAAEGRSAASSA